jgi:hypothetical protein
MSASGLTFRLAEKSLPGNPCQEILAVSTENFFCYIRVTKAARGRIFHACGFFAPAGFHA